MMTWHAGGLEMSTYLAAAYAFLAGRFFYVCFLSDGLEGYGWDPIVHLGMSSFCEKKKKTKNKRGRPGEGGGGK